MEVDSGRAGDWVSLIGATASIGYGLLFTAAEFVTVGLGALALPGTLRLAFAGRGARIEVEKT